MRILESGNAHFIENGNISGSNESRNVEIKETLVETFASNIPSQVVVPITVAQEPSNYGEQRYTEVHTPHHDVVVNEEGDHNVQVDEQVQPQQEVVLKRSTRVRRSTIPDDYIVYALEHESDLSMDNDPVSFKEAVESNNSEKWYNAMKEELKSMTDNDV